MSKRKPVSQQTVTIQPPEPQTLAVQVEQLKAALETQQAAGKTKKHRTFAGFKIKLKFNTPNLAVECDCRYEKITSAQLDAQRIIIHRSTTGEEVQNKPTPYHWGWFDQTGKEYTPDQIHHYETVNGQESEVASFERTTELEISKLIELTEVDSFLVESEYELWSDNLPALHQFYKHLVDSDKAAVSRLSFGKGFTEYHALISPISREGKWGLIVTLTKMRKQYKHLMNGASPATPVASTAKKATSVLEAI